MILAAETDRSVTVALIAAIALIISTLGVQLLSYITGRRAHIAAVEGREEIRAAMKPENGHASLGEGLAAVEERLIEGEGHFDRLDVRVSESLAQMSSVREELRGVAEEQQAQGARLARHLEEVDPLIRWTLEQSGIDIPGKENT